MNRPKLEYAEAYDRSNMVPLRKIVLKLETIQRIATKMVPDLEEPTYEKKLQEMQLTTLKERTDRRDLVKIYKLINNLEKIEKLSNNEKKRRG